MSTSNQKLPNRPKPQLGRNATVASMSRSKETKVGTTELGGRGSIGSQLGRLEHEVENHGFGSPASNRATLNQQNAACYGMETNIGVRTKSDSMVARDVAIDPSIGKGIFHQATLSKVAVREGFEGGGQRTTRNRDEWVEGRRYNPYELVRDAHKSDRSKRATRESQLHSPVRLPSTTAITPPFRVPAPSQASMASPTANMSSARSSTTGSIIASSNNNINTQSTACFHPTSSLRPNLLSSPTLNSSLIDDSFSSSMASPCHPSHAYAHHTDDEDEEASSNVAPHPLLLSSDALWTEEATPEEARLCRPPFGRTASTRHFNAFNASNFSGELPFSQPEVQDDLASSARDQLFAMEMGDDSPTPPASSYARILSAPGPTAW